MGPPRVANLKRRCSARFIRILLFFFFPFFFYIFFLFSSFSPSPLLELKLLPIVVPLSRDKAEQPYTHFDLSRFSEIFLIYRIPFLVFFLRVYLSLSLFRVREILIFLSLVFSPLTCFPSSFPLLRDPTPDRSNRFKFPAVACRAAILDPRFLRRSVDFSSDISLWMRSTPTSNLFI